MNRIILSTVLAVITFTAWAQMGTKQVTLEEVIASGVFFEKGIAELRSMNDGIHYTVLEQGKRIVKYSYRSGQAVETIFDVDAKLLEDAKLGRISGYAFSDDEKFILVYKNVEKIYRRSYTAEYYVYDVRRKRVEPIEQGKRQQMATFSPDGIRVAFARDNNLFIKDLRFGTILQITDDGERNAIINGIPDWVYEEEFATNKSFEWSPDGKFLAYIRYDEREVPEFSFTLFYGMAPSLTENELYPGSYRFKYPKAGDPNSKVSVHVYNTENRMTHEMKFDENDDIYIPRIRWSATAENLAIFWMNRRQDKFRILFANPKSGVSHIVFEEINDRYINDNNLDFVTFLPDNQHFVLLSEKDGFNHIYLYKNTGNLVKQITNGSFEVTDYYGYDAKSQLFYYQAASKSPLQREVLAVDLKGKKRLVLAGDDGTNSAKFSSNFGYFIKEYSSAKAPKTISVCGADGKMVRVIQNNEELKQRLEEYRFNPKEFFTFKTSDGVSLNGWMVKPIGFDPNKKYPVLMVQYSGPGSQEVLDKWRFGWEHFLAHRGYLVVCVDGRGTGGRGEEFKKCTYMRLGDLESLDQIETARYLSRQSYVDAANIGIWGWSYGGFMSSLCLSRGSGAFKMGIAVAPVTHYKFYDTIYTERFMRKPGENPSGYDNFAPLNLAAKLEGELLLCHGMADDNVHFQNAAEYAEALVQAGKQFDMQFYTNRNHSIYGGNTRMHLYTRMFNFMERTLKN
jgi:dipeptidyl-peptidase 4